MPSVGRTKQLLVLALAAAILGVTASTASAAPVWVWACQSPSGSMIPTAPVPVPPPAHDGRVEIADGNCGAGVTLGFTTDTPRSGSSAQLRIALPGGAAASQVRILRSSDDFDEAAAAYRFQATIDGGGSLENVTGGTALTGELNTAATGSGAVTLSLSCSVAGGETCPAGAPAVEIDRIAVLVDDGAPPRGSVGWNNPVNELAILAPSVSDEGVGLDHAEVAISSAPGGPALVTASSPIGGCGELSPGDGTNDRALLPAACLTTHISAELPPCDDEDAVVCERKEPKSCDPGTLFCALQAPTKALPEGKYWRTVTVFDAAGNAARILDQEFEVVHPNLGSDTATLSIGSSGVDTPQPNPGTNPGGGVGGAQRASCRSPRLSVSLDSKPLRVTKGRPVLLAKKRYRFEGRLTCVVNGKRRSAPKGTRIDVLNKVGRNTVSKPATRLRASGKLNAVLKTPNVAGSRTLIFRYRNADGQRSQVSIRITITKRAPKR